MRLSFGGRRHSQHTPTKEALMTEATQGYTPTPEEIIEDLFKYHPSPSPEVSAKYDKINAAMMAAALVIHNECPPSPDRTAAMRHLREARMTANSSIATKSGGAYR